MQSSRPDMPIVIAGNKTDVEEDARIVSREDAESLAVTDWDNVYVEASARLNDNISTIFQHCVSLASDYAFDSQCQLVRMPTGSLKGKFDRSKSVNNTSLDQLSLSQGFSPRYNHCFQVKVTFECLMLILTRGFQCLILFL